MSARLLGRSLVQPPRLRKDSVAGILRLEMIEVRLAAQSKADLTPMSEALDRMRDAASRKDLPGFNAHDLEFRIALCHRSGNRSLGQQLRSLLFIAVLRRGHPALAKQHLVATIEQFFVETQSPDNQGGIIPC